jgi:hypothetical protein
MSGLNPSPLTINDLLANMTIDLDFEGWCWGDRSNTLTVRLLYGDREICSNSVCVESVGFERDKDY